MGADAPGRLDYLTAMQALLWPTGDDAAPAAAHGDVAPAPPAPDGVPATGDRPGALDMIVLPSARTARLLAPVRPRRAGSSAALRYSAQQDVTGRLKGLALAAGIQTGLIGPRRQSALTVRRSGWPSINDHLAEILGQPVLTSLALTHDRANRKPVLQVFDRRGRTIAFAKVGVNDLTRRLVDVEAAALRELAGHVLPHVRVPALLGHGPWNGLSVLVMSPLPALSARAASTELVERAMREIALSASGDAAGTIDTYLSGLRGRAAAATAVAGPAHVERWTALLDAEIEVRDNAELTLGAWHGDWARWNFVARRGRLAVWDWERFARPVPIGYDRLHYFLQGQVGPRRDQFATGAPAMLERAPELLARWPISARAARTTALLYILDIALRYMADDQRATGGGGAVEQWAFPTLEAALAAR